MESHGGAFRAPERGGVVVKTELERPSRSGGPSAATELESCGDVISRAWRGRKVTRTLLIGGIVGAGLYAVGDLISGLVYDGYSFRDQAISELTAIGAPSRGLMVTVITVSTLLGMGFAVGIRQSAGRNRALRRVGLILLAAGAVTIFLHPLAPIHGRGVEVGLTDTMHQVVTVAWALAVFAAVALGAVAYRGWFRFYSLATLMVLPLFGWLAANLDEARTADLATPWMGFFERVNAYTLFAWMVVLAVILLRSLRHEDVGPVVPPPE
jgi:hypothetical membrane protein